jgi:hypothetical protein
MTKLLNKFLDYWSFGEWYWFAVFWFAFGMVSAFGYPIISFWTPVFISCTPLLLTILIFGLKLRKLK